MREKEQRNGGMRGKERKTCRKKKGRMSARMALGSTQINITVKAQRTRVGKRNGRDKRER